MQSYTGIFATFKRILRRFPATDRRKFLLYTIFALILAGFELLTLGFIGLLTACITDPEAILNSSKFALAKRFLPLGSITETSQLVTLLAASVVCTVIFRNTLTGLFRYFMPKFCEHQVASLYVRMVNGILKMPYPWFSRQNPADLMAHINWIGSTSNFMECCMLLASDTILIALLFSATVMLNPVVVLSIITVFIIISALIFKRTKRSLSRVSTRKTNLGRDTSVVLHKIIFGFRDLKIFKKTEAFLDDYERKATAMPRLIAQERTLQQVPGLTLEAIGLSVLSCIVVAMHSLSDLSTPRIIGTLTIAALAAWRGLPAVIRIISYLSTLQTRLPPVTNGFDMLEMLEGNVGDTHRESGTPRRQISLTESITFANVHFGYSPDTPVLHDISLRVEKGESVGIIGHSGAGKSTLVDILIGFLAPSSGTIKIDGTPIKDRQESWMANIGYVPQSPYIFDGTLAENIAFAINREDIDLDKVMDCCEQASINEFLHTLPEGVDTPIGDRGLKLSGGQQQRVCIARALYNDPELLIFDEATSSLDTKNEKSIQNTILSLQGRQTMIIVAHRLSTVEHCDRIVWLDKGRIRCIAPPEVALRQFRAENTAFGETVSAEIPA